MCCVGVVVGFVGFGCVGWCWGVGLGVVVGGMVCVLVFFVEAEEGIGDLVLWE